MRREGRRLSERVRTNQDVGGQTQEGVNIEGQVLVGAQIVDPEVLCP